MSTTTTIDTSKVPTSVGISPTVEVPATRFTQAGLVYYSLALPLSGLVHQVQVPDPNRPLADNRVVSEQRARQFADYLLEPKSGTISWICPPLLLRTVSDELDEINRVHEFEDGTAWVLLRISTQLLWKILDGQHRVLGAVIAMGRCTDRIGELRDLISKAKTTGAPKQAHTDLETELAFYKDKLTELAEGHVAVTLVQASADQAKQMFVDIARNAKGVNPDFTVVLDGRSPIHRIAMELAENHQLLKDRVELGQRARMSTNSEMLIGAKSVADICHGVLLGTGRLGKRKEDEIGVHESAFTDRVEEFLDTLVAGFDDLEAVAVGDLDPKDLREVSLLGSATMLRVLAIAFHELRDDSAGKPVPIGEIEAYFKKLAPHMRCFTKVSIKDPNTGEVTEKTGIDPADKLWMPTGAFLPGAKAPGARQGNIKSLSTSIANWARHGNPAL